MVLSSVLSAERKPMLTAFSLLMLLDLFGVLSGLGQSTHRYFKRDVALKVVECGMCPPGEYRAKPCSGGNQGECERCDVGTYIEMHNFLSKCRKCHGPCEAGNIAETVRCTPETNRKCECLPLYYCLTEDKTMCEKCQWCGHKRQPISEHQRIHYKEACQFCPPGTFRNMTGTTPSCQPHTNCTELGKILHTIGNSSADNHCINPASLSSTRTPSTHQHLTPSKSFSSFYIMWPLVFLSLLCVVILMKTKSCQIERKKQGLGILVKLKFICICGSKSNNNNNNPQAEQREGTATGEGVLCEDEGLSGLKPLLLVTNGRQTPQFQTEMVDIETVAGAVHTKRSIEENIPFPVQENGRNSNSYYPIEEQGRKQYSQHTMPEAKRATETQNSFLTASKYLQDQSPLKSHLSADHNHCV